MTTIRQIIESAFRESGIYAIDDVIPDNHFTEGLVRLNVLFDGLFASELGEPLSSVNYGSLNLTNDYAEEQDADAVIDAAYVPSNTRLFLNLAAATTIYLPPNPRDGARIGIIDNAGNLGTYNLILHGNGRRIETATSVTLSTNSLARYWFYRADTGNWVRLADFVDGDSSPLPEEFDDLLTLLLAVRINPRYGAQTAQESIEVLKRIRRIFRARYRQSSEQMVDLGLRRLTTHKEKTDNFNA